MKRSIVALVLVAFVSSGCLLEPDFEAPPAPEVDSSAVLQTNQQQVVITGTKSADASVSAVINGALEKQVEELSPTEWQLEVNLSAGLNEVVLTATDAVGNVSPTKTHNVIYDNVPPETPTKLLRGVYFPTGIPTLSWNAAVDAPLPGGLSQGTEVVGYVVELNGTEYEVTAAEAGNPPKYELPLSSALALGPHTYTVMSVDGVGNRSDPSPTATIYSGAAGDLNGDRIPDVALGAPGADGNFTDSGEVHVYYGNADLTQMQTVALSGFAANQRYGEAVRIIPDMTGDGIAELAVGAPGDRDVYIHFGVEGGVVNTAYDVRIRSAGDQDFGVTLDAADVDGDGIADLLVGAPLANNAQGRAHLILGSADWKDNAPVNVDLMTTPPVLTFQGNGSDGNQFASSVAIAGDVTGDGKTEMVFGEPGLVANALVGIGQAYVFSVGTPELTAGGVLGVGNAQALRTDDNLGANKNFGGSVAGGMDVNADGYADVVVAAPGDGVSGLVFSCLGAPDFMTSNEPCQLIDEIPATEGIGEGLALIGAFDRAQERKTALAVGNPVSGKVYITEFAGTAQDPYAYSTPKDYTVADEDLGASVTGVGDLHGAAGGTGAIEVVVGAPAYDNLNLSGVEGRAYVLTVASDLTVGPATDDGQASGNAFDPIEVNFGAEVANANPALGQSVGGLAQ